MITSRMMDWAGKRKLCRLIVVNRIDAENVDLPAVLAAIQAAFGKECLPINLPADCGKRVVDCFFNPSAMPIFRRSTPRTARWSTRSSKWTRR